MTTLTPELLAGLVERAARPDFDAFAARGGASGVAAAGRVRPSCRATMGRMSLQDQRRVLVALAALSGDEPGAGVAVAAVDDAVGRRRGDLRTLLSLQALAADGVVAELADGRWALTPDGVTRLARDREASA